MRTKFNNGNGGSRGLRRLPPNAGKGRPRGSVNHFPHLVRATTEETLKELGGKDWLLNMARRYPKEFLRFVATITPKNVALELSGSDGESLFPAKIRLMRPTFVCAHEGQPCLVQVDDHGWPIPGAKLLPYTEVIKDKELIITGNSFPDDATTEDYYKDEGLEAERAMYRDQRPIDEETVIEGTVVAAVAEVATEEGEDEET